MRKHNRTNYRHNFAGLSKIYLLERYAARYSPSPWDTVPTVIFGNPYDSVGKDARSNTDDGRHKLDSRIREYAGQQHGLKATLIDLLCPTILTILATFNLMDIYGSFTIWATAAFPATIVGCMIALLTGGQRVIRWTRLCTQMIAVLIAQCVIGPMFVFNGTAIGHVFATSDTLRQGFTAMTGSFKYLIAITPPVGTEHGALMALWTICLWCSLLTTYMMMSNSKTIASAGLIPVGVTLVISACMGSSQGTMPVAIGIFLSGIAILWVSWRLQLLESCRWHVAAIMIMIAAILATGTSTLIEQHRYIWRDHYDPPLIAHHYSSPLSSMRMFVNEHHDDTLLSVQGLPQGAPVRIAVMDRFDGNVWNLSDTSGPFGSSDYGPIGTTVPTKPFPTHESGERFMATFTIHEGFEEVWLPLAGQVQTITSTSDIYYNPHTRSALIPAKTHPSQTYTETGITILPPTESGIAKAGSASLSMVPRAISIPDTITAHAKAFAGGEPTGGMQAQALADALVEYGWFSHGLGDSYPSLPGHGNYRINLLLNDSVMVGDSEQYASAMALMARELNIPSRVVLGFMQHSKPAGNTEISTISDVTTTDNVITISQDSRTNTVLTTNADHNASTADTTNGSNETDRDTENLEGKTTDSTSSTDKTADSTGLIDKAKSSSKKTDPLRQDSTHISFTGNDIKAWVEIYLEHYGWVAFDPTPDESKIPDETIQPTTPEPEALVRQPPPPLLDPLRDASTAQSNGVVDGINAPNPSDLSALDRLREALIYVVLYTSPIWTLLLIAGIVVSIKMIHLKMAKCRGSPRTRVAAGWLSILSLVRQSGIHMPTDASRPQQAQAITLSFKLDTQLEQQLQRLSRSADRATFSKQPVSEQQVRSFWADADAIRCAVFKLQPRRNRMRIRLSLRM